MTSGIETDNTPAPSLEIAGEETIEISTSDLTEQASPPPIPAATVEDLQLELVKVNLQLVQKDEVIDHLRSVIEEQKKLAASLQKQLDVVDNVEQRQREIITNLLQKLEARRPKK